MRSENHLPLLRRSAPDDRQDCPAGLSSLVSDRDLAHSAPSLAEPVLSWVETVVLWSKIPQNSDQLFNELQETEFTYLVRGNTLKPSTTNWDTPRKDFEIATELNQFRTVTLVRTGERRNTTVWRFGSCEQAQGEP